MAGARGPKRWGGVCLDGWRTKESKAPQNDTMHPDAQARSAAASCMCAERRRRSSCAPTRLCTLVRRREGLRHRVRAQEGGGGAPGTQPASGHAGRLCAARGPLPCGCAGCAAHAGGWVGGRAGGHCLLGGNRLRPCAPFSMVVAASLRPAHGLLP